MSEKACPNCHLLTFRNTCPSCKATGLSEDFSGLAIIFNPEGSIIARAMEVEKKGRYALRVR